MRKQRVSRRDAEEYIAMNRREAAPQPRQFCAGCLKTVTTWTTVKYPDDRAFHYCPACNAERLGVVVETIQPGTPEWDESEAALERQRKAGG